MGASPPSRSAGTDFYLYIYTYSSAIEHFGPCGPPYYIHANVNLARSHPVLGASELDLPVTSKPWLVYGHS